MKKDTIKQMMNINLILLTDIVNTSEITKHINFTQFKIMLYLLEHSSEQVCQKELEMIMKLKKASITGALDDLENKKAIYRVQSEEDKRKKYVYLTKEAYAYKDKVEQIINKLSSKLLKPLTTEEIEQLDNITTKISASLEKDKNHSSLYSIGKH